MLNPEAPGNACQECGAPRVNDLNCWGQLGQIIAWEYDDPELLAQHFLTVASYNLQHPAQFTPEAIAGLKEVFVDYLDQSQPIVKVRRRIGRLADGSQRVLRPKAERVLVPRAWRMTIADVYTPDRPQGAAERVLAWAASVRAELG